MDKEYKELAAAVVRQAAVDYRSALLKLIKYPRDRDAHYERDSLECFFCSDWFTLLSNMDGKYLMRKIKELTREELEDECYRKT